MRLGVHYYTLSIEKRLIRLFEAFRDVLIKIEEGGFPIRILPSSSDALDKPVSISKNRMRAFLKEADQRLGEFFIKEPLKIAITGDEADLTQFRSISIHKNDIVASITGSFENTSDYDLGKLAWAAVKLKLSGIGEKALQELESTAKTGRSVSGIHAVWQLANQGKGDVLIVENGYRLRGRLNSDDNSFIIDGEPEVTSIMDDVVEMVIEKVVENGGRVIFVESGSLKMYDRIALINQEKRLYDEFETIR